MKIVVLTGAGISAESGISTFRDADGLWEGHDVMSVASPDGWVRDPKLVLDFYNQRRRQLKEVKPNAAHLALQKLEDKHDVVIITQNVDDLHERAESTNIIHLHGELRKVRSVKNASLITYWEEDIHLGDLADDGGQLRPHIVWFGEDVPEIMRAAAEIQDADAVLIIGTSMQVYPAAGLVQYAPSHAKIYYIDPKPHISYELSHRPGLTVIEEKAGKGVSELVDKLITTF